MRIAGLIAGGLLWALLVFLIALHVHFPGDVALERAKYEMQQATDGDWAFDADELALWRLTGASLHDATLYSVERPTRRRRVRRRASGSDDVDNAEDEPVALVATPFLHAERLRARLALLPLLVGDRTVRFDSDLLGGELDGSVTEGSDSRQIVASAEDLDLSQLVLAGETWEVNAIGTLDLDADLDLHGETPRQSTGELRMAFDGLAIRSAKAMGIELTPIAFSEAVLDVEIKNGKAEITKGVLDGDALDATFEGYVSLSKRGMSRWRVRVDVKLELDDTLDQFARFSPDLKDARDESGVYHLACNGMLARPVCTADRAAAGTLKKRPARPDRIKRRGPMVGQDAGDDKLDAQLDDDELVNDEDAREERRADRLARIRARRERLRQERKAEAQGEDLEELIDDALAPPSFDDIDAGPRQMPLPPDLQPPDEFLEAADPDFGPDGGPMDDPQFDEQQMDDMPEPY